MQSIDLFLESAREFLHQVAAFLPRLLLALVVVAIGWLLSKAARFAVERGLRAVNFTVLTERAGTDNFLQQAGLRGDTTTLFGLVAYWLAILATLMIAFNGLGLTYITDLLGRVVLFTPKLLVAMLVVVSAPRRSSLAFGTRRRGLVEIIRLASAGGNMALTANRARSRLEEWPGYSAGSLMPTP